MKKMQALWLENQTLTVREVVPIPEPNPGEALIRLRLAGICATDLEMVRGYYPFTGIPGHEFVGEVVASPDESGWVGRRVVGEINLSCGACASCQAGRPTHCQRRRVLGIKDHHGAFAEYLILPLANLHPVPEGIPDEAAVFTEPLAAALEIQEQVHILPSDQVLLVGAGRLGQLVAQSLALTGCNLSVVARRPKQRELLAGRRVHFLEEEEIPLGEMDVVIEATGSADGFSLARRAVRPRGTMVLKSTYKGDVQINLSSLVVDEITLVGSRCGPFPPALHLLETGQVSPQPMIESRFPLSAGLQAFAQAAQPGVFKVLLQPGLDSV